MMALFTSSISYDIAAILVSLTCVIIAFYKWSFTYWKRRGVPDYGPIIPFGTITKVVFQKLSPGEQLKEYYNHFTSLGEKHGGMFSFTTPIYVPCDLDIIKHILVKDFNSFVNRGFYIDEEVDPLTKNLVFLKDEKWKSLRSKLTPTFTSGKIKMMFNTMKDCTKSLSKVVAEAETSKEPIELREIIARFATDVIGSCAFGVECNSLENPEAPFRKIGQRVFGNTYLESMNVLLQIILPDKILRVIKYKSLKTDVEKFILDLVKKTVAYREQNKIARDDFLHLLIQLKNKGEITDDGEILNNGKAGMGMTIEEITAQVFIFFVAGFETSSSATNFSFFELAQNQDMQNKLRKEINQVLTKHKGEYTYEAFMDMKYLEQVINEAMRMYPPLTLLNRQVSDDKYKVPGTSLILEKGTKVAIPILGIHYDEKYYPNPHKFDPERFSSKNKSKIPSCAFLPFGDGPRNCIGMRFGYMQTKMALATIIRAYKVTLNDKTKLPIKFDPRTLMIHMSLDPIWFNLEKI